MDKDTYKDMTARERETVAEPGGNSNRPATDPSLQKMGMTKSKVEKVSELEMREGPFGPVGASVGKEKSTSARKGK